MDLIAWEKDCSALGGLFQQIVGDMKGSNPVWIDFSNKANKLHSVLGSTVVAVSTFFDAFQKVADLANSSKGATRDIGAALTRLCVRHRSIENKLRDFVSILLETLISPMQEKMEDWKKAAVQLDRDHSKEYKKLHQDIKKSLSDINRIKKQTKKGQPDAQTSLENAVHEAVQKYAALEQTEKIAVKSAMVEERARFCNFVGCLKPLMDKELAMLTEITHIQEIVDALAEQTENPTKLPQFSEEVFIDIKGSNAKQWLFNTPPASPMVASDCGSHRSSLNSIRSSSSNSLASVVSPSHNFNHHIISATSNVVPHTVQVNNRFRPPSSVSSMDSGFVSPDGTGIDSSNCITTAVQENNEKNSNLENGNCSAENDNEENSIDETLLRFPRSFVSPPSTFRLSSFGRVPPVLSQLNKGRHTISCDRSRSRPALTSQTFQQLTEDSQDSSTNCISGNLSFEAESTTCPKTADVIYSRRLLPLQRQVSVPHPSNGETHSHNSDQTNYGFFDDSVLNQCSHYSVPNRHSSATLPNKQNPFKVPSVPSRLSSILTGKCNTQFGTLPVQMRQSAANSKPSLPVRSDSIRSSVTESDESETTAEQEDVSPTKDTKEDDRGDGNSGIKSTDVENKGTIEDSSAEFHELPSCHPALRQQAPPEFDSENTLASSACETLEPSTETILRWPSQEMVSVIRPSKEEVSIIRPPSNHQLECNKLENNATTVAGELSKECSERYDEHESTLVDQTLDFETGDKDDTHENNMLDIIRRGVQLRRTITNDRSAPRIKYT